MSYFLHSNIGLLIFLAFYLASVAEAHGRYPRAMRAIRYGCALLSIAALLLILAQRFTAR